MRTNLLISTSDLAELIGEPDVRIVDMRWSLDDEERGARDYLESHIPGAVYLHWLRDISDPSDPIEGQIASEERFSMAMAASGIGDDTLVVVYDDGEILMAPRLVWSLHYYGHEDVRVLDGGWRLWLAENRPIEQGSASYGMAEFTASKRSGLRATKSEVLDDLNTSVQVLDCRMDETWVESGAHIPGARRFPAPDLLNDEGKYIGAEEVRRWTESLQLDPKEPVLLYCGGGVSASAAYLALRRAGFSELTVYDGSWSEWGTDADTPKQSHVQSQRHGE